MSSDSETFLFRCKYRNSSIGFKFQRIFLLNCHKWNNTFLQSMSQNYIVLSTFSASCFVIRIASSILNKNWRTEHNFPLWSFMGNHAHCQFIPLAFVHFLDQFCTVYICRADDIHIFNWITLRLLRPQRKII